jgi:hypothetical protein
MDEEMMQMMAMEEMMGGGMGAGGGMGMDPFGAGDAPAGYTMVYVPDAVLPAVMELVDSAEMGMGAGDPMAGGMGMDPMAAPMF